MYRLLTVADGSRIVKQPIEKKRKKEKEKRHRLRNVLKRLVSLMSVELTRFTPPPPTLARIHAFTHTHTHTHTPPPPPPINKPTLSLSKHLYQISSRKEEE